MSYGRPDPRGSPAGGSGGGGGGGGGRWDSERFQRERDRVERGGGRFVEERDRIERTPGRSFEERDFIEEDYGRPYAGSPYGGDRELYRRGADRLATPPRRRERSADERFSGGRPRFDINEFSGRRGRFDDDGYGGGRGRFDDGRAARARPSPVHYHEEDHEIIASSQQPSTMIPYRPSSGHGRRTTMAFERPHGPPASGRGRARPGMIRRQSSLDTFDRKPMTRYVDREIDIDYRAAAAPTPPRPLPRMRRSPPRSPPGRYEREYEEIRVAEPDYYGDENFRDYRERDVSTRRTNNRYSSGRPSDGLDVNIGVEKPFPRRGKTKMPRRLVERSAISALGYPFDEEGETVIILKALSGDQIDEIVRVSEEIRKGSSYKVDETRLLEASSAPAAEVYERRTEIVIPASAPAPPPAPVPMELIERVTTETREKDSPHRHSKSEGSRRRSKSHGHKSHSRKSRSKSKSRRSRSSSSSSSDSAHDVPVVQEIHDGEASASVRGPLTVFQAEPKRRSSHSHGHKSEKSIKTEIKALEREEKALKLERKAEREERKAEKLRKGSSDAYLEVERNDGVKLERTKKDVDSKLLKAMMVTLT